MRYLFFFLSFMIATASCSTDHDGTPELVPEKTDFTETSSYQDVMDVVDYARKHAENMHYEVFGQSEQGKDLPLLVFSDQVVESPEQAATLNRPVVFIVANIHSGEVEGKEALLRLILELTDGEYQPWLKKVTLLLAPIYNADGNDMIDRAHRTNQYGPSGGVGTRPNAEGLNLNRDFTKLAASESQGLVGNVLTKWDPAFFMDLHTTNGSRHGYHLTYAPPLHPDTDPRILDFEKNDMLPQLRKAMKEKGWEIFDYGNFRDDAPEAGWFTYSGQPRYSSNYYGLKNRLGLLSETYSYVDYKTRIDVAGDFVKVTLNYMAEHADEVRNLEAELDSSVTYSDTLQGTISYDYTQKPKDFQLLISDLDTVYQDDVDANMLKRMGIKDTVTSKLYNEFEATATRPVPFAYALDNSSGNYDNITKNLEMHGIDFQTVEKQEDIEVQRFEVSEVKKARQYEGRQMLSLSGSFTSDTISLKDWIIIPTTNSNRMLIFQLLEPESEDGYVAWHMLGDNFKDQTFPIVKVMTQIDL